VWPRPACQWLLARSQAQADFDKAKQLGYTELQRVQQPVCESAARRPQFPSIVTNKTGDALAMMQQ